MARFTNNAEGGSNTTTVTTGNTGGTSGDAFSAVSVGANSVFQFSTTQAAHGTLSYRYANQTATLEANYVEWSAAAAAASYYGRFYMYLPATPTGTTQLLSFRQSSGGLSGPVVTLNTSRQLQIRTNAQSTVSTSTTALSTGQWYRIEWLGTASGAASMDITLKIFSADSATALETLGPTTAAAAGAITTWQTIRLGQGTGTGSAYPTTTDYIYFDDLVAFDTAYPGAAVTIPYTHIVRYRLGKNVSSGTLNFTVTLMQGTTQIAQWTHSNVAQGFTTYEQALDSGQIANITNTADLRLRFVTS